MNENQPISFCKYIPSNNKLPPKKVKSKKNIEPKVYQSFLKNSSAAKTFPKHSKISKNSLDPFEDHRKTLKENPTGLYKRNTDWKQHINPEKDKINVNDYNIFHIDSKIKENLSANISRIPDLEEELKNTLWIFNHGNDPSQKIMAKQNACILRKRIQDLESTFELGFYIFKTANLVEEYRNLLRVSGIRSFVKTPSKDHEDNASLMRETMRRYLCIAQNYVEIENISQKPLKMKCPACQGIEFDLSPDDDSIYICKNCQTIQEVLDDSPSFKDTDRVNMSNKYTYSRKGHFIDAKKRFQGTQNTDPNKIQSAVRVIEEQMKHHNLVKERGNIRSISKDHVYDFLSEQDLSNHYEDLNLIFLIITGEPCPDISEYDNVLDDLFDEQEQALHDDEDDRVNSLNVNYKLYKLLQKVGYRCRKADFHILRTPAKEDEHDEKMKKAWKKLGWSWIPTF